MPYIYALCDPDSEEVRYVGKANDVRIRYSAHLLVKGRPNPHRIHWIQSLLRQGKSPVLQILEEVTEDTWAERERWWISEMNRQGVRLTNLTDGGEGLTGFVPTEEQRRKMSEAQKKRPPVSEETRHKLNVSISAYAATEEARQRVSQAHTGLKHSAETRARQSAARVGMKFTPEHRANISRGKKGSIPYNKGKNISEAQIRSLSLVHQVLTSEQVHEVRALLKEKKVTQRVIARMFNVSPATITRIKQGYIYYTEKES